MARRRRRPYNSPLMIARRNRGRRYFYRPFALIDWLKSPALSPEQEREIAKNVATTIDLAFKSLTVEVGEFMHVIGAHFEKLSQTLRDLNTPPNQP